MLLACIKVCSLHYGVEPEFALAVAQVESRTLTRPAKPFRVGRLGHSKYYGPFGIHRCYLKRWAIDNPCVNILVGVRALRGTRTIKGKRRVLRRYNASYTRRYYRAVMGLYWRYKRNRIFRRVQLCQYTSISARHAARSSRK